MPAQGPAQKDVFLNCPFDKSYSPLLRAMQFTVLACGFRPRCALERDNAAEVRLDKIMSLIRDECALGIHDISLTECDGDPPLPRFNMPFELGLHLGVIRRRKQADKSRRILILDRERYRFQRLLSDIAGQDIRSHGGTPHGLIAAVRSWLSAGSRVASIPGTALMQRYYDAFITESEASLSADGLTEDDLSFYTWSEYIVVWLEAVSRRKTLSHPG